MDEDKRLWKLPDRRDWLWGKLDLALVGKSILSKYLIQFSANWWVCITSLWFGLCGWENGSNGYLLQKDLCQHVAAPRTVVVSPLDFIAGHCWCMPSLEISGLLLLLLSRFSCVWLCSTTKTAVHQAPPSLGFSRQEHLGCHFLLQCVQMKSEREVVQLCLTLSHPMDCSLLGSSVHRVFQARVLDSHRQIELSLSWVINFLNTCIIFS